jgi:hypothetical protein
MAATSRSSPAFLPWKDEGVCFASSGRDAAAVANAPRITDRRVIRLSSLVLIWRKLGSRSPRASQKTGMPA